VGKPDYQETLSAPATYVAEDRRLALSRQHHDAALDLVMVAKSHQATPGH
jgi:hypothetical protein